MLLGVVVFFILITLVYIISSIFSPTLSLLFTISAVIFMIVYTYGTYNYGDKVVLAATKAMPVKEGDKRYNQLINIVDEMSIAAGITKPKVYVIESNDINAFATGKNPENASIAVTTGLLENLKRDEIQGVIGHEMTHIRNYDIRFATFIAVFVGLVAILSDILMRSFFWGRSRENREDRNFGILIIVGLILAIVAPIFVRLVQLAISRRREFAADAGSAELTRYPEGLASALEKIMKINQGKMKVSEAVSHLFFSDPNKSPLDNLFATHPPLKERIKILRSM
jgi:heat shock protein HtpX